jgi:hypothetical protein
MTLLFGITTEPHRAIFYSHAVQSSIAHSIDLFIPRFQQPPAKLRLATISFDAESLIQLATTIISGPANVGRRESPDLKQWPSNIPNLTRPSSFSSHPPVLCLPPLDFAQTAVPLYYVTWDMDSSCNSLYSFLKHCCFFGGLPRKMSTRSPETLKTLSLALMRIKSTSILSDDASFALRCLSR